MTLEERYPFHPLTLKRVGDRVKVPKFPTDESRGYDYGILMQGPSNYLYVYWDEKLPASRP
jgi:hypothetical protein